MPTASVASARGNETAIELARQYPHEFLFGANEVTDLPEARGVIEKYLKAGAIVIGEQKFRVECDSPESQVLYALAAEYRVPILLHFQHEAYNLGFDRFHKMLEKYPKTVFIGHAQTWWANIDRDHADQKVLYPKGKVTAGGLTDRYLSDYPNAYADMSAGSGLNALTRDEDHAREFLRRHQDKILYGSDCLDPVGSGAECQGSQTIAAIRRLAHRRPSSARSFSRMPRSCCGSDPRFGPGGCCSGAAFIGKAGRNNSSGASDETAIPVTACVRDVLAVTGAAGR